MLPEFMRPEYIYFEMNTGIVKTEPIRSNFYVYRLPSACLGKVELAVADATLGSSGLNFPEDFMAWLEVNDTKWDQKSGLAVPFEKQ